MNSQSRTARWEIKHLTRFDVRHTVRLLFVHCQENILYRTCNVINIYNEFKLSNID